MSNVNLDYMLRQAQANVNANKNNAAHQAQVQAQAKAAQERQAYVEEHKNTYKPTQTPVLPTQPKQEQQQKLDALMRNGNQKQQPTKYYTVGAELQHDDIDPHWTTYKPVLPQKQDGPTNNKNLNALLYGTERAAAGLLGYGENLTDFVGSNFYKGIQGISSVGGLLPNKVSDYAGKMAQNFVDESITRDYEQSIKERYNPSQLQETATGIGQGINNMLASIAIGQGGSNVASALSGTGKLADAAQKAQTAADIGRIANSINATGAATREAREEGATVEQAMTTGALTGATEALIESLAGGIPGLGKGKLSEAVRKVVSNPIVNESIDIFGEGVEEAASEIIAPFIKRAVYDKDAELATADEIAQSAILGMITSGVLKAGIDLPQAIGNKIQSKNATKAALPQKNATVNAQTAPTMDVQTEAASNTQANAKQTEADNKKRMQQEETYRKEIDGVFDGSLPSGKEVTIGDTPEILQKYGAKPLTLHMSQSTVRKIAYPDKYQGGKHNMGLSVLKNLPEQLRDPIAIIKNPQPNSHGLKSLVVLTQWHDAELNPVIAAAHLDANGAVGIQNNIATVFGAENYRRLLGDNNENVLYTKNNEDIEQLLSQGRHMPEAMADDVFATSSINKSAEFVKDAQNNITYSAEPIADKNRDFTANNGHVGKYLSSAINDESKVLGKAMGVPYSRRTDFAKDRLRELANSYMRTGALDAEAALSIFDDAWEQGIVINRELYDQYKDLKRDLQNTRVQVTDEVKANIPEYTTWRKYNHFRVGMTDSGGVPIDQKYQELSMQYPNLFPESITDLSEQLMKMAEVSGEIQQSEKTLSELYGDQTGENYRAMRKSFSERMQAFEQKLKQARDVQAETDTKNAKNVAPQSLMSTKEAYATAKAKRKEYERMLARSSVLLTDVQKRQIQALAAGKLTAEEIPNSAAKETMLQLAEIRKEELAALAPVKAYKEQYRNSLRNTAAELLEGSYAWKDKSTGLQYSRETMERNVRDIVTDGEQAKKIIGEYFTPVHKQEAARTRFKNEMRDKVRAMDLNEIESYAVQFLGEKRAEIADMEEQKLDIRKMRELNELRSQVNQFLTSNADKIDLPKVERAITEFHSIYDSLFEQMNDVRVRNGYEPVDYRKNYFPHFLDDKPDTLLSKLGAALGVEINVKELPVDIAGRTHTFRPGIQWFGNTLQRQGTNTGYDAVKGFDKYIEGISNVIYHTDNIQKLRALSNEIRYEGTDAAIQEMIDKIRADENMSDYEKQSRIKDIYEDQPTKLSKFVQELEEYTNILAGKKSRRDRNAEANIGRKLYSVAQNLNNRVAANMVALNPASWVTNFAPLVQTASQTNPATMARALKDTVKSYAKDDGFANESTFLTNRRGSNPLVVDTYEKLSNALSKPMEWIDNFTSDTVTRARYYDNMNRGMSHDDALDEADSYAASLIADRSKGALPTIFEAKNPINKIFTAFQVEVNNQLSWMFKDLPQDERNKSAAMVTWKLMSLFIGSYLANDLYEKLRGSRVLFDPLSWVNEAVGDVTGYQLPNVVDIAKNASKGENALPFRELAQTDESSVSGAIGSFAGNVASELPFVGGLLEGGRVPISSALPDLTQTAKLLDPEVSAEKKKNIVRKELLGKPLTYMALPFGGGQIKKTVEGIEAVAKGGSYTVDNEGNRKLQYPVFKENDKSDILPYAQAAVFGKSSLPTAKDWVDSGFKTKSVKFTQAYDDLAEQGINTKSAYDFLEAFNAIKSTDDESSTEQKRAMLLADETMTPEQKAKIDDILLGSKWEDVKKSTQTAIVNARVDDTTTDADKENLKKAAAAALDRIEQVRGNTEEETLQLRREALEREDTLSDEQKDIVRYKLLDGPVSYESAIEHRRSTDSYQNKAKIAAFGETGGSVDDFYSVYDRFKKVKKNDEETAIEQKRAMLLADDTLTPEQKTKLDELLLNSKKPVSYESEAEHRRSLATESQQEKIAGFENIGGTVDAYYKVYDAFKSAEGDSALPTAQKKKNVYNALPTKYQRIVDETPKDENLNALKSYLLQSMSGLTDKEKQYLDSALIGNDIMPMERTVTYGNDSAYALSALGESWVEKYNELASPAKIDADTFVKAYYAAASATWAKGENGAKSKAVKAAIDAVTPGMTKEQRRKLYEANGVGKTYW